MEEMSAKYYTPQIEDLFYGAVCEIKKINGKDITWEPVFVDEKNMVWLRQKFISVKMDGPQVRIKCLDREDIENLGFTYYSTNDKSYFGGKAVTYIGFFSTTNYYLHYLSDSRLVIEKELEKGSEYVFQGKIKNKSELKKLLTQLEILK